MAARKDIVSLQRVERIILLLRGQKVLLDRDLAALYGVEIRALNQAVRLNIKRFPTDFMFKLTREEIGSISQIVISSGPLKFSKSVHAFTKQGVAMLSSVLNSPRAIRVNIEIIRVFVQLRQMLVSNADLARRLAELEKKHDSQFKVVFEAIRELMAARRVRQKSSAKSVFIRLKNQTTRSRCRARSDASDTENRRFP